MYRFGILGSPIKHSLSPVMHAASFRSLGLDAEYVAFDVAPADLASQLTLCQDDGFCGLNITIPHKTAVMPLLDRVDPIAAWAGAVNTIRFDADGLRSGYNTDILGFLADLKESCGITPAGKRVLVVGCGGAGRAIALGCLRAGAKRLALANRSLDKAQAVAALLAQVPDTAATVDVLAADPAIWCDVAQASDLIVQCTSAGLHADDVSPLPAGAFRTGQVVYDVVYSAHVTPTLRLARLQGAHGADGLGMLVHQGAASFALWTGREADIAAMRAAIRKE